MKTFLLAGGGTGGHISPALAVAEFLEASSCGAEVRFAATGRPVDRRMYASREARTSFLDPPRADGPLGAAGLAAGAVRGLAEARRLIRRIDPCAVLATGGYSSFFCAAAAGLWGIPVLLHESNAFPGRANRTAALFSRSVLTGYACAARVFGRRGVHTGNPVRPSLRRMDRDEARRALGLDGDGPVVLVLGGSQGASRLNALALEAPRGIRIVLQCGSRDEESVRGRAGGRVVVRPFDDDMAPLYSSADLAVARAGAMTIAELAHFGLPSVLIPYPHAAGDHQTANAREAERSGMSSCVAESSLEPGSFWEGVTRLLGDREALAGMTAACSLAGTAGAVERIAQMLMEAGGGM